MRIQRHILFIFLTLTACTGNKIIQNNRYSLQDSVVNKWTHAVIHIQGEPSSSAYQNEIWEMYVQKKISWEAYTNMLNTSLANEEPISGTGIFFQYKGHYLLITARHILANATYGDTSSIFPNIVLVGNSNNIEDHYQEVIDKTGKVAALAAQSVCRPGPHARAALNSESRVNEVVGVGMFRKFGCH